MEQHNNKVPALLKEAETLFPNSLSQKIQASITNNSNSVICIIIKINNAKTAAALLVNAFETEQSKSVIGEFCRTAITAKADLVRLLNSQPYSPTIAEAIAEANKYMDVITLLWSANDER